ncbi:MAG: two-component system CheB/CheR fusion protein [Candidatus Azotimanducaceae bacterium]
MLNTLLRKAALAFDQYKHSTLPRRIERRMAVNKLNSLEDHVAFVDGSDSEAGLLLKDMQLP